MTLQLDGKESKVRTAYPEMHITAYFKTKEEAVTFVAEALTKFVPEDIWQWTIVTVQDGSEDSYAIRVTISYSDS